MPSEKENVKSDAAEHDAQKGETGDSSSKVGAAGHQFRNDAQDLAKDGDEFSQNLTKDWDRDRDSKEDVPSKTDSNDSEDGDSADSTSDGGESESSDSDDSNSSSDSDESDSDESDADDSDDSSSDGADSDGSE